MDVSRPSRWVKVLSAVSRSSLSVRNNTQVTGSRTRLAVRWLMSVLLGGILFWEGSFIEDPNR